MGKCPAHTSKLRTCCQISHKLISLYGFYFLLTYFSFVLLWRWSLYVCSPGWPASVFTTWIKPESPCFALKAHSKVSLLSRAWLSTLLTLAVKGLRREGWRHACMSESLSQKHLEKNLSSVVNCHLPQRLSWKCHGNTDMTSLYSSNPVFFSVERWGWIGVGHLLGFKENYTMCWAMLFQRLYWRENQVSFKTLL